MSELTDSEVDVLSYNIRETLFHPRCDACGWTIWPDRPYGIASGQVEDSEGGGPVDDLRICERCVEVGPCVWIDYGHHWSGCGTRTVFDSIVKHGPEQ